MQLAYRSGKLNNIYADVVYKKEVEAGNVAIELGADRSLRHTFDILSSAPMRNESDENPIVLAYAVAVFKDNSKHFEFVTEYEVQKRKSASSAAAKGFLWTKWIDEAWKKTAIRKLCKYMDLSPEIQKAVVLDEQADAEGGKQRYDFAATIDVDFAANTGDQPQSEQKAPPKSNGKLSPGEKKEATRRGEQKAAAHVQADAKSDPAQEEQQQSQAEPDLPEPASSSPTYPIYCPNRERDIEEDECGNCSAKNGCPSWGE